MDIIYHPIAASLRLHAAVMDFVHFLFHPTLMGAVIVVLYALAWRRMEFLAERRREFTNKRLAKEKQSGEDEGLPKPTVPPSVGKTVQAPPTLDEYLSDGKGVKLLFGHTSISAIVAHMKSKGRVPLGLSEICQPVLTAPGTNVFWQSRCIQLRETPRIDGYDSGAACLLDGGSSVQSKTTLSQVVTANLLKDPSPTAATRNPNTSSYSVSIVYNQLLCRSRASMNEVLTLIIAGGSAVWKDHRGLCLFGGKETLVWVNFDFHDGRNFLGLFIDQSCWKRIVSLSVAEFLCPERTTFDFETQTISFSKNKNIPQIKVNDAEFFHSLATLFCYADIRAA